MSPVDPGKVVVVGLTAAVDVTTGPRGRLYVSELNSNGVFAAEQAFEDPSTQAGMGALIRVSHGSLTDISHGKLAFPGSAVVDWRGSVVVENYLFGANFTHLGR